LHRSLNCRNIRIATFEARFDRRIREVYTRISRQLGILAGIHEPEKDAYAPFTA
jgi:hypothetical protein